MAFVGARAFVMLSACAALAMVSAVALASGDSAG
jgi:hypothetical protein